MADVFCSAESLEDAEVVADSNYVFQRVGELCFSSPSAITDSSAAGSSQLLTVAAHHGITVFADNQGDMATKAYQHSAWSKETCAILHQFLTLLCMLCRCVLCQNK